MTNESPSDDVLRRAEEIYSRLARERHWDFYPAAAPPEPTPPAETPADPEVVAMQSEDERALPDDVKLERHTS